MKNKKFFSLRVKPVNNLHDLSKISINVDSTLSGALLNLKQEDETKTIHFLRVMKDFNKATDAESPIDALKPNDVLKYLKDHGFKPVKNAPNYLLGMLKILNRKTTRKKMAGFLVSDIVAFSAEKTNIFIDANGRSFYLSAFIGETGINDLTPTISGHRVTKSYGDSDFIICTK